jgi:hypothetical protein
VQLLHQARLARPLGPRDEHQLGRRIQQRALERPHQHAQLGLAAQQLAGDLQPVGDIALAQRERVDLALLLPARPAHLQVVFQPGGALVAVVTGTVTTVRRIRAGAGGLPPPGLGIGRGCRYNPSAALAAA